MTNEQYDKLIGLLWNANSILYGLEKEAKSEGDSESVALYDQLCASVNSVSCRLHEKFDPEGFARIREKSVADLLADIHSRHK